MTMSDSPRCRLLLVDDDRLILATLAQGLRLAGYDVVTADSGRAALERATKAKFDLAVLDIRMPGMSGPEIARRFAETGGPPCLFLSAYSDIEQVREAVNEGAMGYVIKPVEVSHLIPALETALARARDLDVLGQTRVQLERALAGGRQTSIAVGILMERRRLAEASAFAALRDAARAERRKVDDHAGELVAALERLNRD